MSEMKKFFLPMLNKLALLLNYTHNNYLRQGGYVFASVSLSVCLSVCLSVIKITQKATDQFLRKF